MSALKLRGELLESLVNERVALEGKLNRLRVFKNSAAFDLLAPAHQEALGMQYAGMMVYLNALRERVRLVLGEQQ